MGAGGHGPGQGGAQARAEVGRRPGWGSSAEARSGRRPIVEEGAAAAAVGRDGGRGADKGGGAGRHEELGRRRPVGGGSVTSKNSHSKITRIKNYFQNIFQKL